MVLLRRDQNSLKIPYCTCVDASPPFYICHTPIQVFESRWFCRYEIKTLLKVSKLISVDGIHSPFSVCHTPVLAFRLRWFCWNRIKTLLKIPIECGTYITLLSLFATLGSRLLVRTKKFSVDTGSVNFIRIPRLLLGYTSPPQQSSRLSWAKA